MPDTRTTLIDGKVFHHGERISFKALRSGLWMCIPDAILSIDTDGRVYGCHNYSERKGIEASYMFGCPYSWDLTSLAYPTNTGNDAKDITSLETINESKIITNTMSTIIEKVRNVLRKPEDRMMLELGLENPVGVPTQEGLNLLMETLYEENREKLIKRVTPVYEEEKEEKSK